MPTAKKTITTKGFPELAKYLDAMPQHVASIVLPEAIKSGAKVIVDIAKAKAPRKTGALKRSITQVVRRYKDSVVSVIGPESKYRGSDGSWPAKYAHLVEYGRPKKDGSNEGARPFMRPAVDTGSAQAANEIERVLKYGINKFD